MEDFNKEKNENGFTPNYTPLDRWADNGSAAAQSGTGAPAGFGSDNGAAGAAPQGSGYAAGQPTVQGTERQPAPAVNAQNGANTGDAQSAAAPNFVGGAAQPSAPHENGFNAQQAQPQFAAHQAQPQFAPARDPQFAGASAGAQDPAGGARPAPGAYAHTPGAQGAYAQNPGTQGAYAQPQSAAQGAPAQQTAAPRSGAAGAPGGYTVNRESGEYRYVPPFEQGAYDPNPHAAHHSGAGFAPQQPPMPPRPPKEKKHREKGGRRFSTAAIVLILCAAVLLSFGSGMAGALIVGSDSAENSTSTGTSSGDGGTTVIYKTPVTTDTSEGSGLSDVCGLVSDSVVEITTEYQKTYGNFQYVNGGAGSGVIISTDGYIITNNHVITDEDTGKVADTVTVRLTDSTEYTAKVIGHDPDSDIAVIKIDAKDLTAATLGTSGSLKVGEQVIAVGNPLGELGGTVTSGIISSTNREITVDNNIMNLIQIDAAINPGNSGGGLFNMKGELIGIVNAKSTGSNVEGLGFAIPIDEAGKVAEELMSNGYVSGKTYIGISLTDVTDSFTAYYYFHSQNTGVYITQVQEGYNDSALKYGDRILAIDGEEVASSSDVKEAVKGHSVGDTLKFTLSRDGKTKEVDVKCYEYVPDSDVTFGDSAQG